jgi:hypothetical protein
MVPVQKDQERDPSRQGTKEASPVLGNSDARKIRRYHIHLRKKRAKNLLKIYEKIKK